jgi:exonuclease V gamma subunit
MNAELIMGRIKVHAKNGTALIEEWQNLIWKEKGTKKEENPACPNHRADAALYAWRFAYQYLSEAPKPAPAYGSQAWMQAEVERMEAEALEYFTKEAEIDDPDYYS